MFNQRRKIKSMVFSSKVALCMFNKRRMTRRNKEGEFSLKVFNRRGGREGKGICREMRAERGKGGYCKVPVEFKFLQYCCGIIYNTCNTYNTYNTSQVRIYIILPLLLYWGNTYNTCHTYDTSSLCNPYNT